jgi:SPP1 gp7 family putative phage head morphogenesis protein
MPDEAHIATDKLLERLEGKIADEYAKATAVMQKKLEAYLDRFEEQRKQQKELLDAGKITKKEYQDWVYRHEAIGKRWEAMKDVLAADLDNARNIALKISGEQMPDVYAMNANYAAYQIEHGAGIDTGFVLYNHDTAEYLLKDTRQLMPPPSPRKAAEIAVNKAMQWDKARIQSAVLQGILQGENPRAVAARLRGVAQMDYNASVRYARTMTTSAQNAGRYESFRRADKLGVDLTIEWQATLDSRTRHDHRMMHGQRTTVDKPFHTPDGYTIYYPADCTGESTAPQGEIWNCRCTLLAWVKGFEGDTVKESPKMGDMSFEEWLEATPEPKRSKRHG